MHMWYGAWNHHSKAKSHLVDSPSADRNISRHGQKNLVLGKNWVRLAVVWYETFSGANLVQDVSPSRHGAAPRRDAEALLVIRQDLQHIPGLIPAVRDTWILPPFSTGCSGPVRFWQLDRLRRVHMVVVGVGAVWILIDLSDIICCMDGDDRLTREVVGS